MKNSTAHFYIRQTLKRMMQLCRYENYAVEIFPDTDPLSLFSDQYGPKRYIIDLKLVKTTHWEEPKWCNIQDKNAKKFCLKFQKWVVKAFE